MSAKIPQILLEQLEQAIASMMVEYKIPGASIACSVDDEIIYSKGFGARDLTKNQPATPNTLFGFGSNSKSYTALAIMQLVENGKISVEDPVSKYIPFKLGKKKNPITIHHLLSHSSGIPALGSGDEVLICRLDELDEYWIPMSSWDDFFTFMNGASQEVIADPGERFAYSNEGFVLLQAIIEKITNMKYAEYIRQNILDPLEMNRSTFLKEKCEHDNNIATCHYGEIKDGFVSEVIPRVYPFHELIYGAGGLLSSTMEQINYLRMNMNEGVFNEARLLNAQSLEWMHEIHIETDLVRERLGDFGREGYGYGWVILEDFFGYKIVAHSGNTMVCGSSLMFVPEKKIGIAMAANTNRASSLLLGIPILIITTLLGKNPIQDIPFVTLDDKLNALTGVYESYKGIHQLSVIKRGGLLYIEVEDKRITFGGLTQGSRVPLIPVTDTLEELKFHVINGPAAKMDVEFSTGSKNKIDLMIAEWVFHKIKDL